VSLVAATTREEQGPVELTLPLDNPRSATARPIVPSTSRQRGAVFLAHYAAKRDLHGTFNLLANFFDTYSASPPRIREALADTGFIVSSLKLAVHGYVASWNSGAARLKGWLPGDLLSANSSRSSSPPEDQAREFAQQALAAAARTGRFESESWQVRAESSDWHR
jgi:hypothetical protein